METLYYLFPPASNTSDVAFSLHEWGMEGSTVREYREVERFPVTSLSTVGRLAALPPRDLVDRVDALVAAGADVNTPHGWRDGVPL